MLCLCDRDGWERIAFANAHISESRYGVPNFGGDRCGPSARLKIAFELAAKRRQKVTSVDKPNVRVGRDSLKIRHISA
jgi:hypothetical protein